MFMSVVRGGGGHYARKTASESAKKKLTNTVKSTQKEALSTSTKMPSLATTYKGQTQVEKSVQDMKAQKYSNKSTHYYPKQTTQYSFYSSGGSRRTHSKSFSSVTYIQKRHYSSTAHVDVPSSSSSAPQKMLSLDEFLAKPKEERENILKEIFAPLAGLTAEAAAKMTVIEVFNSIKQGEDLGIDPRWENFPLAEKDFEALPGLGNKFSTPSAKFIIQSLLPELVEAEVLIGGSPNVVEIGSFAGADTFLTQNLMYWLNSYTAIDIHGRGTKAANAYNETIAKQENLSFIHGGLDAVSDHVSSLAETEKTIVVALRFFSAIPTSQLGSTINKIADSLKPEDLLVFNFTLKEARTMDPLKKSKNYSLDTEDGLTIVRNSKDEHIQTLFSEEDIYSLFGHQFSLITIEQEKVDAHSPIDDKDVRKQEDRYTRIVMVAQKLKAPTTRVVMPEDTARVETE